jgi:hypothetical protein
LEIIFQIRRSCYDRLEDPMPTKRQRRQKNEVVKLIVTTRERFPHTPGVMRAMRRVIWRYAAEEEAKTRSAAARRKRRSRSVKKSA